MNSKITLMNPSHPGHPSGWTGASLWRVIRLSVLLLFVFSSAMSASDSEVARQYMEGYPAVQKAVKTESDSELAQKYMAEHPLPDVKKPVVATPQVEKPTPVVKEAAVAPVVEKPTPVINKAAAAPVVENLEPVTKMTAGAAPEGDVARVKTFTGTASIVRANKVIAVNRNEKLYQGDTLRTGKDGSLGIIFRDNTLLSLGPDSAVIIDEFLFSPAQGKLSIVTRMLKGTASYLSGIIAKLSPKSVRFLTPVANVGFRGTKFLVKIEEEKAR
jgi:hypothetical protein